ncbi:MAG: hypothetical protein ACD_81C00007G0003 [uncultured bacterium]|uniref:Uncharacterized protein n=1 Tax=Candidatus Wolfebacteria bacterium GW2011_GWC2_39_22 TaxID=1619013 RepID=A0A0G0RH63_9BACT|nr:MAG: hypothetical protein ACD_81C00007G0003 [uncultured bacterium]KKR13012.1 MAG: hypothetical protein UT41_C0001G0556 [Candidatus Wolfebacteria bacterium GW2011_GWC2_39_22]HBC71602.1 hypothetical protein [Coxiellaceae bacterium]HBG34567.1 hypothetical protein [Holosporales bacterium]HBI25337.1 hypothetical protein [Candidatus Wolfebacteria bacterium]
MDTRVFEILASFIDRLIGVCADSDLNEAIMVSGSDRIFSHSAGSNCVRVNREIVFEGWPALREAKQRLNVHENALVRAGFSIEDVRSFCTFLEQRYVDIQNDEGDFKILREKVLSDEELLRQWYYLHGPGLMATHSSMLLEKQ